MDEVTNFERIYHKLFQLLKKMPINFFFSQMPEQLSNVIISEFCADTYNKHNAELVNSCYVSLISQFSKYIRSVKMNNQLPLLESPKRAESLTEKILNKFKEDYPTAFQKKHKRTKKRYGVKQTELELPEHTLPCLLQIKDFTNVTDDADGNTHNP